MAQILTIKYIDVKDCFFYVPTLLYNEWQKKYNCSQVVRLKNTENNKLLYSILKSYNVSNKTNTIYLNKKYAESIGLEDNGYVTLEFIREDNLQCLDKVFVRLSEEDFDKVSSSSNILEENILKQVKCVSKDTQLPIWINRQIFVTVFIERLDPPTAIGQLRENTELYIAPYITKSDDSMIEKSLNEFKDINLTNLAKQYFSKCDIPLQFDQFYITPKYARVYPLQSTDNIPKELLNNSYLVFVNKAIQHHDPFLNETLNLYQPKTAPLPHYEFNEIILRSKTETEKKFCSHVYTLQHKSNIEKQSNETKENCDKLDNQINNIKTNEQNIDDKGNIRTKEMETNMGQILHLNINSEYSDMYTIYLQQSLMNELNIKSGTKVFINHTKENIKCNRIVLHKLKTKELKKIHLGDIEVRDMFVNYYYKNQLSILYNNSIILLSNDGITIPIKIQLKPDELKYCIYTNIMRYSFEVHESEEEYIPSGTKEALKQIDSEEILNSKLENSETEEVLKSTVDTKKVNGEVSSLDQESNSMDDSENEKEENLENRSLDFEELSTTNRVTINDYENKFIFLNHLNKTIQIILNEIKLTLKSSNYDVTNLLIIGNEGCGKTTLSKILKHKLNINNIFCDVIDCNPMKNKVLPVIEKSIRDVFVNACYYDPSCVIFDDIDVFCNISKDVADPMAKSHYDRLCSLFVNLVKEFQSNSKLIVIGLTSKKDIIKLTKANIIFSHTYSIPTLDLENRKRLFENLIKTKLKYNLFNLKKLNLNKLSKQCEGYCIEDITDIIEKAIYEYLRKKFNNDCDTNSNQTPIFSNNDLDIAFESHVPLSLKGIKMDPIEKINFSNVGGLNKAKQLLIETLIWPSKYPQLFKQCPLKCQTGVLLYGAPGTGKTLLASAISGECGLKFISIKGPELFSKFIGESEEGVRNVFQRARSIQPCILFFDEFDSLATKRGSDNTGVTDRVVNQLLTELDGVESLDGVYVLAATSRPDLIDSALLRPGRLGNFIQCTLPDEDERLEILTILSEKLKIVSNVNLTEIAKKTERYSGADLLGLLYTAQSLHEENIDQATTEEDTGITQNDLLNALEDSKPSLGLTDSARLHQIYSNFAEDKGLSAKDLQNQQVISA